MLKCKLQGGLKLKRTIPPFITNHLHLISQLQTIILCFIHLDVYVLKALFFPNMKIYWDKCHVCIPWCVINAVYFQNLQLNNITTQLLFHSRRLYVHYDGFV